ncbi:uncharacterized protein UTRI_06315 [Ustilago trichophora]|uniref:Uncharacterized protein n=1 Tax=Ustilago trichophora TaxID=86804 RepID=A0A5C3EK08_9BASI|nr:uncharacterized protein UTRI_06315 [Ustilago trichophora]
MPEDAPSYIQASSSSARMDTKEDLPAASSASDGVADLSKVREIYYPCFGNVDAMSYCEARMYGLSFRRLHDEWVVMGKPQIDTSHWPRMIGHRGLPTSPEDLVNAAEYYDRKLFSQVMLVAQGKPANRDRPLDDFVVSMVTVAAVINADFVTYRLVRDQPTVEEAIAQRTWHHHFTTFLQDSIRFFCIERRVCDRLGPHDCIIPLLFGQAHSMSLPTLLETFAYQVEIFQNLFPNFGEHISRCAEAQPQQPWTSPSGIASPYAGSTDTGPHQGLEPYDRTSSQDQTYSTEERRFQYEGEERSFRTDVDSNQQQNFGAKRRLIVAMVPGEVKQRNDTFAANIDSAIRCDVPLDKVVSLIDSKLSISTSTSASSASTPLSITTTVPIPAPHPGSEVSRRTSVPSSDSEWPKRRRGEASNSATEDGGADIDSSNLTLRPPLQSHASWSGGMPGRSTSEEHNTITPEEALAAHQGRAHNSSAYSYFSSLPTTPTELISPTSLIPAQEGHASTDRRTYRSNTGLIPLTSSSDPDSRKRTRAEQNREKMKAYHRRVMQQREALTSVLTDMSAHVGAIPMSSMRAGAGSLPGLIGGDGAASIRMMEVAPRDGTMSSFGRSTQEQTWSVSLRNKQKQESKARLRKREIDQVHELGLYANYATAILGRSSKSGPLATTGASSRLNDEAKSPSTSWRQLHAHQVAEADVHMSQAILRVFLRHRPTWIALISAEQRLATEVAKLSPKTEEVQSLQAEGKDADGTSTGKGIKALIDRLQMEERAGTLAISTAEATTSLPGGPLYDHQNQLARGNAGMYTSALITGGGADGTSRAAAAATQQFAGQGTFSQPGLMEGGTLILSPGASDYEVAVSPSGVTRAAGVDEGSDYFAQERRRHGSRYSGGSDPGSASVLAVPMATGYSAEQAGAQIGRMSQLGGYRSLDSAAGSGMAPSVLSSHTSYGYNTLYAGEGSQQRMGAQELERQSQRPMGAGMQPSQAASSMQEMQLRVSTPYDGRGYGQTMMHAAPGSRVDAAAALYHTQPLQAQPYEYQQHGSSQGGAQASGEQQHHQQRHHQQQQQQQQQHQQQAHGLQAPSPSMLQYRSGQPGTPQYPPRNPQQYPYNHQPGSYGGP